MPRHDYIFVDESGDPGYAIDPATGNLLSTPYYVLAALHICDDCFSDLSAHIASFRYLTGMNKELKLPPGKDVFRRLIEPIAMLVKNGKNIWATAIYLNKRDYTGGYLKPEGRRPPDPFRFRNRMLRYLLEFHFSSYPLRSEHYDLVLDRIEMTKDEAENLRSYLARNYNLPTPTHITHASSIYVEALQVVHHLAAGFKDVVGGKSPVDVLSFVKAKDVTKSLWAGTGSRFSGTPPSP